MANYFRVSPKFWPWARRQGLSSDEVSLALYLLTCKHRNLEGLYALPKPYVAADLKWSLDAVEAAFAAVVATGFAEYDEDAEMVLIPKALKHQSPSTDNQIKGAIAQLRAIPRTSLWDAFRIACASHCPKLAEAVENEWPSHSEGISHTPAAPRADAGAGPSSSSNSISTPPLAPPATPGGNLDHQDTATPEVRRNSRMLGTSGRHQDRAALAAMGESAAALAVSSLDEPSDNQRAAWDRLRAALLHAAREQATSRAYVADLRLVATDGAELVIDGPSETLAWVRTRLSNVIAEWARHLEVEARLVTEDEHNGFTAVAA